MGLIPLRNNMKSVEYGRAAMDGGLHHWALKGGKTWYEDQGIPGEGKRDITESSGVVSASGARSHIPLGYTNRSKKQITKLFGFLNEDGDLQNLPLKTSTEAKAKAIEICG